MILLVFTIVERLFCPISTFEIAGENLEATATKHVFSWATTYDLHDSNSDLLATTTTRFFAWGTSADVFDSEGHLTGKIEENPWRITPWAEYQVKNPDDSLQFIAEMDFLGTEFKVFHPNNPDTVLATISRPLIHFFRDSWTIEPGPIDPKILTLIAILQTDKDNRDRFWKDFKGALSQDIENYDTRR